MLQPSYKIDSLSNLTSLVLVLPYSSLLRYLQFIISPHLPNHNHPYCPSRPSPELLLSLFPPAHLHPHQPHNFVLARLATASHPSVLDFATIPITPSVNCGYGQYGNSSGHVAFRGNSDPKVVIWTASRELTESTTAHARVHAPLPHK